MPILNMYTCKEAIERLNDYLDRELTPREMQLVKRHLKICHECSKKFAFEAELLNQIKGKLKNIDLPADLMERVSLALSDDFASE